MLYKKKNKGKETHSSGKKNDSNTDTRQKIM